MDAAAGAAPDAPVAVAAALGCIALPVTMGPSAVLDQIKEDSMLRERINQPV